MVAMMAMGSLGKQTRGGGGLQSALTGMAMQQLMGGGAKAGGLGGLLGGLMGGGRRAQTQQRQQHQNGMGMLGKMLDADGDGSTMDDILGMVMNSRR